MKFFSYNFLIYIILVVNNAVHSTDIKDKSDRNSDQSDNTQVIASTSKSNDSNNSNCEIITSNLSNIANYNKKPKTYVFSYVIQQSHRDTLSYPNKIDKIKFNDYVIRFEDGAKLPSISIEHLSIYTCEHYSPVLIFFYTNSRHYFYSVNKNTKKWTNHKIQYHIGLKKYYDENGTRYYTKTKSDNKSPIKVKSDVSGLVKELCKHKKSLKVDTSRDNKLGIVLKKSNPLTAIRVFKDSYETDPITKLYIYRVYDTELRLKYPNKLDIIRIGDYIIKFEDGAKLPSITVENISIYTCEHNKPVIIYFSDKTKNFFYSLDAKTNKWTNYKLRYDERFKRHTDENGVSYYSESPDHSSTKSDKYDPVELASKLCNEKKCSLVDLSNKNIIFHTKYLKSDIPDNISQTFTNDSDSISNSTDVSDATDIKDILVELTCYYNSTYYTIPSSNVYMFKPDGKIQEIKYPNKLEKIEINGYIMEFEDKVRLPRINVENISIYTCQHKTPVLIYFFANSRYYFYSVNKNTNKWASYKLKHLENFKGYTELSGIDYYKKVVSDDTKPITVVNEVIELVKDLCKINECNCLNNTIMKKVVNFFKLFFKTKMRLYISPITKNEK